MIASLALTLAGAGTVQADPVNAGGTCPYGIEHFVGSWRADPSDDVSENDTSVIEFTMAGGASTWRQYLHFRELDQGRWLTSDECGTVTLLSPSGAIIVARFKVVGKNRIQLERSGQVYTRAPSARAGMGV